MKISKNLLKRYSEGKCTIEEVREVENWLNSNENEIEILDVDSEQSVHNIWNKLDESITSEQLTYRSESKSFHIINWSLFAKIAASFLIVVGIAYFIITSNNNSDPSTLAGKSKLNTIKINKGQKATITLQDGTIVYLNGETEIKYPESFDDTIRTVYLSGEAFFKVAKDKTKPFIVYTKNTQTRVLGTAFNVKSYENDKSTSVTVEEGKVSFANTNASQKVLLTANMKGEDQVNRISVKEVIASKDYAWRDNVLLFDYANISEIESKLERWYGIDVVVQSDKWSKNKFTGNFPNTSLAITMQRMAYVMKFNYTIENNKVLIY